MKMLKTPRTENRKHNLANPKLNSLSSAPKTVHKQQMLPCPPVRSECIHWLYRAQNNFHFSRSTLFLSFSLLDRLLQRGLSLNENAWQLVTGALLLVCTKFNEVYPLTVRKLNMLMQGEFSLQQYAQAEAAMLQALDFTVELDSTYEQLCALEASFQAKTDEAVKQQIKLAILNPNQTFIYGTASLVSAVQQSVTKTGLTQRSSNNSLQKAEGSEIEEKLRRLAGGRRLVSPSRC